MNRKKLHQILQEVIARVWEDEAYKKELLARPLEAIKTVTKEELEVPEGKTLVVVDQTDSNYVYLNLPAPPRLEDVELQDELLDAVAGGRFVWPYL